MFIFFAIIGLTILITGIILKRKFQKKVWTILICMGVLTLIVAVLLFIGTLLLINGDYSDNQPIREGGDWHTWRGYSPDYVLYAEINGKNYFYKVSLLYKETYQFS
ncbi:hypothetical protein [Anaerovorax odorimutans]|uniref:hypothetical protein n=1 Tax=Anaerovorax odorimutans TaxID=109327 RepID=UPI00048412F2|nr:hypothetical protein [Anaerovorax odorimutans]